MYNVADTRITEVIEYCSYIPTVFLYIGVHFIAQSLSQT